MALSLQVSTSEAMVARFLGTGVVTGEDRVFAVQGDGAAGAPDGVVVALEATVGEA